MWILLASPTQRIHHETFWILCRKLFLMNVSKTVYGIVLVLLWLQIKNYKNAWFSSATQRRIENPVKQLRWGILWKRLLVVNYFCKRLYFRYLRGFWIRLCHLWHKFSICKLNQVKREHIPNKRMKFFPKGLFSWKLCIYWVKEFFCLFISF